MDDDAYGEDREYLAPRFSLISILSPLVRVAAVAVALFSFLGISLGSGTDMLVPHIPGLALVILALVPVAFVRKSMAIFAVTVVVALVGAVVSIEFAIRYSTAAYLLEVLLLAPFILRFALGRRRQDRPAAGAAQ